MSSTGLYLDTTTAVCPPFLDKAATSAFTPIVFAIDDDVSVRNFIEMFAVTAGCRAEAFASAAEFLARPRALVPSCLVLDVGLARANGLDMEQRLANRPEMPIIFISGCGDVRTAVCAMKAGAVEFLMKPLADDLLLSAMHYAIERSRVELVRQAELETLRRRHASLTRREREVMSVVARGRLNKQVAAELGISEITVKAHRGKVMRKMEARSFADLLGMAAKLL
jgi:FixJ family two-component response regulator